MNQCMKISLSPACNPRRFVRKTVRFLAEQSGRLAIASGPPASKKTEFSLRCAYHLARRQKVLFLSGEIYPDALVRQMLTLYDREQISRRDLFIASAFGWSSSEICRAIDDHQSPIIVVDSLNLMDVEPCDLEKMAREANVSILATRVIT